MQIAQLIPEHNASFETMQPAYPMRVEEKDRRPYRLLRQQWMQHYQNQVGGPGALAAALDSTDTHITAMVKGRRNVGDDLADKLEETFNLLPGTIDLCDPEGMVVHPSGLMAFPINQPAVPVIGTTHAGSPTLAQALEVVAGALYAADDLTIDQVRPLLSRLVDEPSRAAEIVPRLSALLSSAPGAAMETAAFAGKPKSAVMPNPPVSAGEFVKR